MAQFKKRVSSDVDRQLRLIKPAAGLQNCKHQGRGTVGAIFSLHLIAYDKVRLGKILRAKRLYHEQLKRSRWATSLAARW